MKNLQQNFERVVQWNKKCGIKFQEYNTFEWHKALKLQCDLLVEESQEALEGIEYDNYVELLDGVCDSLVIISYLIAQLEDAGFDVEGAMESVLSNNDKKIFNSYFEAVEAKEKLEERDDKEYFIQTSTCNNLEFYTILNEKGKIQKYVDFPKVDLSEFVPK